MGVTWFASDHHFGHRRIIELGHRPFADLDEMHAELVRRHNEAVAPDDDVVFVGDVCYGSMAQTLPWLAKLNGRKLLVPGNHDHCWDGHHDKSKVRRAVARYREEADVEVVPAAWVEGWLGLRQRNYRVCHFPYCGDHTETVRYPEHRPHDDGQTWLIHGHVHDAWLARGRQINVGVDAWNGYPVPLSAIDIMAAGDPIDAEPNEWVA